MEIATFGAGCFWGVEATFRSVPGVKETAVGYSGGRTTNPTYQDVCSHATGHAEVVRVTYNPAEVSYRQLLDTFWASHDPTLINRQGPDIGDNYRSVIYYHTDQQKQEAEGSKSSLDSSAKYSRPIATQIESAVEFWQAEEYHQQYLEKRRMASCHR
ncbi:MAG: peptide-methionine (S)-S-oxide reductase MsrA [Armatimonadota bacterium]